VVTADVSARLAWPDDAASIARVQLTAWREMYADLIAPEALAALDADEFAERWAASLTTPPDARMRVLVALERADVRGFTLVHPSHDPDADPVKDGEVGEFIVDPAHRGEGHGSRLLQAAMDTLAADQFTRARWWISTTDDALREWVTGTGWEADGAHRELQDESGRTVKQVRLHTELA
jgi:GNAT superfamily N-acetyltransferase